MDHLALIYHIYEELDNDRVDNAVMKCLRLARLLKDYLYAAVLLHEMHPEREDFCRVLYEDTRHLKRDAQEYIHKTALKMWLKTRTLEFSLAQDEDGQERNILNVSVGQIDAELDQWERTIQDLQVPAGMTPFDTAAFFDQYVGRKDAIRLRMQALQDVKQRIKTRCLNYAIRIEREFDAQQKTTSFLGTAQGQVNNYFKTRCDDVYTKLQKASQLVDSNDSEDQSLLLTEIRRTLNAVADFWYPAREEPVRCTDGKERTLGQEQYLNRLQEYLVSVVPKSASRELIEAELELLAVFMRRLHNVASKGVHAIVSREEAQQGVLGLYMFLYNITLRLEQDQE